MNLVSNLIIDIYFSIQFDGYIFVGIYVNPKNPLAPSNFHGLGVRVEDDVLIKENGPLVLSRNCPKEIAEIEAIASENQPCSKST